MIKRVTLSGLALIGMFASASVLADVQPGFYVGAGVGQATVEVDDADFDADDTAFKVFGGYNFNSNFALEVTYFDAGKPEEDFGFGSVEVGLDGINLSALFRAPLGEVFSLFGKIGYASYDAQVKGRAGNRVVFDETASDEDLSYGFGGAFNIGPSFELRAEYEAVDIADGSFTVLSVGGLYKF